MVVLEFYNAVCRLKTEDALVIRELRELLSYEVPGADHIKRRLGPHIKYDGRKYLLSKRSMTFPSGLLPLVVKHLKTRGWKYKIVNHRIEVATSKLEIRSEALSKIDPRDYQIEARAVHDKFPRGIVVAGTGAGKTTLAGMVMADKGVDTLFITPDTGLREQAAQVYRWMFGDAVVGTDISEGKKITVQNYQSLVKREMREFERIKMVMIDEFHHSSSQSYLDINNWATNAYFRYGYTGTPVRTDGTDLVMHGVLSRQIYKITTSDLIERGWLVPPMITIFRWQLKRFSKFNYREAYRQICEMHDLQAFIADIAKRKMAEDKRTLLLVRGVEHGAEMHDRIPGSQFINGKVPMRIREQIKADFNGGALKCLIATSVMGEGQDIPNIDVFINARFEQSEILTKQGIGRGLRLAQGAKNYDESVSLGKAQCEVYDFLIIGQKNLKDHSVSRILNYKSERAFRIHVCRAN